jgi:hypothetical protein
MKALSQVTFISITHKGINTHHIALGSQENN